MGECMSTLTVINDTADTYVCQVGPDMAAAAIGLTLAKAASMILGRVAGGGKLAGDVGGVGALINNAVKVGTGGDKEVKKAPIDYLIESWSAKGYTTLKPGDRLTSKWTLSLWRQAECFKVEAVPTKANWQKTLLKPQYMRPIFTGPTCGSNLDHSLKWWVDKVGPYYGGDATYYQCINMSDGSECNKFRL